MSSPKALHELMAERLILALKAGTSPFQQPWNDLGPSGFTTPRNPTTGNNYRGTNAFWLALQNRQDPRWLTFKQASAQHWSIEKGAKATLIHYIKLDENQPLTDEQGRPVRDEHGNLQSKTVKLQRPIITNAWVFNAEQVKGIPDWKQLNGELIQSQSWEPLERAEELIRVSRADIRHGGNDAYYHAIEDFIQLPKKLQFDSAGKYYATLLHELGHWTAKETRLNRPLAGKFGSEAYAREELKAEIASLMIGSELHIGHDFGQHAAYVKSWISLLEQDPYELQKAAADAQRIFDFVIGMEQKRVEKRTATPREENGLTTGEIIPYQQSAYQVISILKDKSAQMEDLSTGNRFKLRPQDGLYHSLIQARSLPPVMSVSQQLSIAQTLNNDHPRPAAAYLKR